MKYSLLSVSTPPRINIGDYVQALASSQFLPKVDSFIEREKLRDYDGEETNMIMNAYYMHDGTQWPPSPKINPLFVAVHINTLVDKELLSDESIAYLKKYEPIGCRDRETERKLKVHGVDAYFSGCMTLTFGRKYKNAEKDGIVYFVDMPDSHCSKFTKLVYAFMSMAHFSDIKHIYNKKQGKTGTFFYDWYLVTKFYLEFSKIIDKELLLNAEYITQENEMYNHLPDNESRMKAAEELIKKYAKAALVITSRIHCALPCLGMETPVLFVYNDNMSVASSCRLEGLVDLFNVIHWTGNEVRSDVYTKNNKLTLQNITPNKTDWKRYADALAARCTRFINGNAK